jgi:hypothetical protein
LQILIDTRHCQVWITFSLQGGQNNSLGVAPKQVEEVVLAKAANRIG